MITQSRTFICKVLYREYVYKSRILFKQVNKVFKVSANFEIKPIKNTQMGV